MGGQSAAAAQSLFGVVTSTFVSPEDIVWQVTPGQEGAKGASPLVPDLNLGLVQNGTPGVTNDYRYSWIFTGQQSDSRDATIYDGSVVIFENRPFAYDPVSGTVAGEPTVEAVFGYSAGSRRAPRPTTDPSRAGPCCSAGPRRTPRGARR